MEENIDKLKESEEKYKSLVENMDTGIANVNLRRKFTFVNEALCNIIGYTKKEMIGKSFSDFLYPKDKKRILKIFLKSLIRPKGELHLEFRMVHKDGHIIPAYSTVTSSKHNNKLISFNAIIIDETEKKIAEEKIKTSEARYRSYIEATKQLGWTTNAKGLIIEDIPTWRAYTGQSFEKIKNWGWIKAIHPDDAKRTAEVWKKAIKTKSIYETEYRIRGKDGKYKWFLARGIPVLKENGSISEWIGTCIDISERTKIEEEIKNAQEKWSSLTQNTNDIIMIVDDKDIIQYINKTIPPYTPEKTIGKSVYEYVPREQQYIMMNSLRKVFKTGNPDSYEISSNIPKIGTVWFATKVVPIKHGGRIDNVIMISTDTTKQKNVEEEIKTEKTRLESYIEGMSDGVVILTLKGGVINVNKAYSRMFGREKSEVIGKSVFSVGDLPKKEFLGAISMLKGILQKGSVENRELTLLNKEKKEVPILFSATLIKDRRGKLESIFTTFKDITERKKAEEELKERENRYRTLVENLPQKVFLKDRNSVYISCNDNYAKDLKIKPDRIAGKTDFEFYPKELAKKYRADDNRIMKSGKTDDIEERYVQNGKERWVHTIKTPVMNEKGNVVGILGIFWDVTEQKKAQEEVATAWKYSKNLIANIPNSILVFNDKLKCTSANWMYYQTFKKNIKHIEGNDITHTLSSGMIIKHRLDEKVKEVLKTGKTIELPKCQYNSEIYNVKIVKITKKAEEEEEEEERFVMVIIDDVTEKVKAEEKIKKARNELADKVAELERFSKVAVGRELKMVELKKRIKELER